MQRQRVPRLRPAHERQHEEQPGGELQSRSQLVSIVACKRQEGASAAGHWAEAVTLRPCWQRWRRLWMAPLLVACVFGFEAHQSACNALALRCSFEAGRAGTFSSSSCVGLSGDSLGHFKTLTGAVCDAVNQTGSPPAEPCQPLLPGHTGLLCAVLSAMKHWHIDCNSVSLPVQGPESAAKCPVGCCSAAVGAAAAACRKHTLVGHTNKCMCSSSTKPSDEYFQ